MTPEQQRFAAENHGLVLQFLNKLRLPEEEFYDVVVLGYLRAVKRYFTEKHLRQYSFSTIAWSCMRADLINYHKAQSAKKRHADVISIHSERCTDGLPPEYSVPYVHDVIAELETRLLLHELAGMISKEQMQMVRMRSNGYDIREIARIHNVTMKCVRQALDLACSALKQLCYE